MAFGCRGSILGLVAALFEESVAATTAACLEKGMLSRVGVSHISSRSSVFRSRVYSSAGGLLGAFSEVAAIRTNGLFVDDRFFFVSD